MTGFTSGGFRPFVWLWFTQGLSVLGSAVAYFAVSVWLVSARYPAPADKAELALALTAMALVFSVPGIVLAPVAGVVADRFARGRIMQVADAGNAVVSALIAFLALRGNASTALILGLMGVSAVLSTFHSAALEASYVLLVPQKHLARANAMMSSLWSVSGLVSPALAALLVSASVRNGAKDGGLFLGFTLDAVSFLVAALAFLALRIPRPVPVAGQNDTPPSLWLEARAGWDFLRVRPPLLVMLGAFAVTNFCLAPFVIFESLLLRGPLAPDLQVRGLSFAAALAVITTTSSAAALAGSALMTAWGGLRRRRAVAIFLACLLLGLAELGFGLSRLFAVALVCIAVMALTGPLSNAHSGSVWQSVTPPELQGRVFAVRRLLAQGITPLSLGLFGALATQLDPGLLVAALGGLTVLVSGLALLRRDVRELGDQAQEGTILAA